jgi:hypothetical protein
MSTIFLSFIMICCTLLICATMLYISWKDKMMRIGVEASTGIVGYILSFFKSAATKAADTVKETVKTRVAKSAIEVAEEKLAKIRSTNKSTKKAK